MKALRRFKQSYWFQPHQSGIFWVPITTEGWLLAAAYSVSIATFAWLLKSNLKSTYDIVTQFLPLVFIETVILCVVCLLTSQPILAGKVSHSHSSRK